MKKKVLVLGATGMLGSTVHNYFDKKADIVTYATASSTKYGYLAFRVDRNFRETIDRLIQKYRPNYIINCIGVIRPKDTFQDYQNAIYINALLPKYLADICTLKKIRFIHISTDCVFSGNRGNYTEDDLPDETSIYGLSKYLGEACRAPNLTIRTSIIGREKGTQKNLLEWFLNNKEDEVLGYTNVMWNGVTTLTLAKIIYEIIHKNIFFTKPLIQIASTPISKYDLLNLFANVFKKNVKIRKYCKLKSNKILLPSPEQHLYFKKLIPSYETQIRDLKLFNNTMEI